MLTRLDSPNGCDNLALQVSQMKADWVVMVVATALALGQKKTKAVFKSAVDLAT